MRALLAGDPYDQVSRDWFQESPLVPAIGSIAGASGAAGPINLLPSQWIVRLTPEAVASTSLSQTAEVLSNHNVKFQLRLGLGLPGLVLLDAPGTLWNEVESALRASDAISYFQADGYLYAPQALPNDTAFAQLAGLDNQGQTGGTVDADIDAPEAWNITTGSDSVVIGVIDTGVDYNHPDLAANIWINAGEIPNNQIDDDDNGLVDDVRGYDFHNQDADPMDDHRHGTHVAGTIAAVGNNNAGISGVTWSSKIMPLKFLDANNRGLTTNAVRAITYATLMREQYGVNVRVLNASWGSTGTPEPALRDVIAAAGQAGILVVAAAGNGNILGRGVNNDETPFYPASFTLDNVLTVAASDQADELAPFSNFGRVSVDLAAPGMGILSTEPNNGYATRNGTSMAAPHVAGVAALVWSQAPQATYQEVRQQILLGVDPRDHLKSRVASGGRLNAFGALTVDRIAPRATLDESSLQDISEGGNQQTFVVSYLDNTLVDLTTIGPGDIVAVARNGSGVPLTVLLDKVFATASAPQLSAAYKIAAPGGFWDAAENGTYDLFLVADQVRDFSQTNVDRGLAHNFAAAKLLGTFTIDIPNTGELAVNSFLDTIDTNPGDGNSADASGNSTLRSAIMEANAQPGVNTLRLAAGNYTLTRGGQNEDAALTGDLDIQNTLTIIGSASGETIIDAAALDRVFDIQPGATLELINVTVRGGNASAGGGARNAGTLKLVGTQVTANTAASGGAIHNAGQFESRDSTLMDNTASEGGGGLYNAAGAIATISNSTFSGNSAAFEGGAVSNHGTLTLTSVTLADNSAFAAGGLFNGGAASATARNTLIATNSGGANPDISGAFVSQGNNLIGNRGSATGFTANVSGDIVGSGASPIDPRLAPLAKDHHARLYTHGLLADSPAINRGSTTGIPALDQRGFARTAAGGNAAGADIGAFERYHVEIRGVKFHDLNHSGALDDGEPRLAGYTLYLDLNNNALFDAGEPVSTTSASGEYQFVDLLPGTYTVREAPALNFLPTQPRTLAFSQIEALATGAAPTAFALADLDGDGDLDAAVARTSDNTLRIYMNLGDGTHSAGQVISTGAQPSAVAARDLNNDGRVDLIVAHQGASSIEVYLQDDLHHFDSAPSSPIAVLAQPMHLATADIDQDGDPDLVVGYETGASVSILTNNGQGALSVAGTLALPSAASAILLGEFDATPGPELVVAHAANDTLSRFTNNGSGAFTAQTAIFAGGDFPSALAAADFDGDRDLDLAVAHRDSDSVALFLNKGLGEFAGSVSFAAGDGPIALVAADLDGDRMPDLALANKNGNALSLLVNRRDAVIPIVGADLSLEVNSQLDLIDLNPGNGAVDTSTSVVTLRAAIMEANAFAGDDTISLPAGVIQLSLAGAGENASATGDLDIAASTSLVIIGQGADNTIIDAGALDRVFDIHPGATLTLRNLTVRNGQLASALEDGGGIRNQGSLILDGVNVESNRTLSGASGQGRGGGIFNGSSLSITRSTIANNDSASHGGGLANAGSATILSSTISSNEVYGDFGQNGGGIYVLSGGVGLTASTVTENKAVVGGGIYVANSAAPSTLNSTIVAQNAAAGSNPDLRGAFTSQGYNLIGIVANATGLTHGTNNDQVGTAAVPIDARLQPLRYDFSPTPVHVPFTNSPAIDRGAASGGSFTDQRGVVGPIDIDYRRALVNYGDGSGLRPLGLKADGSFNLHHTYALPGEYEVVLGGVDAAGATGWDQFPVAVSGNPQGNSIPVVNADSLISWWQGEDNVVDSAGSNNGIASGAANYANGKVGRAFNFSGAASTWLQIPRSADLSPQEFTVESWIFPRTVGGINDTQGPVVFANAGPSSGWVIAGPGSTGRFTFTVTSNAASSIHSFTSGPGFTFNQWYHVAMTWDGSTLRGFVNGTQVGSLLVGNVELSHSANESLYVGGYWNGRTFDGLIDELSIANRALAAAEIQAIASSGSAQKFVLAQGGTLQWTGHFADGDMANAWSATVDYGDSSGPQALTLNADKTYQLNHTYIQRGTYPVVVTISDGLSAASDVRWVQVGTNQSTSLIPAVALPLGLHSDIVRVNAYVSPTPIRNSVGIDDYGNFVAAWESTGLDGSYSTAAARRFSSQALPLSGDIVVNDSTFDSQLSQSVAVYPKGAFIVNYQDQHGDGDATGMRARRYDSEGRPLGGSFLSTYNQGGNQSEGDITLTPDGGFITTHLDENARDGSGWSVYATRFDAAGVVIGADISGNEYTAGNQAYAKIAAPRVYTPNDSVTDHFVMTWWSDNQDGSSRGVYARRYDLATGVPLGGEFRVNVTTAGEQAYPEIDMADDGSFVIAWHSGGQDGDGYGVYARKYDPKGNATTGEIQVHQETTGDQQLPSVAIGAAGDFHISWVHTRAGNRGAYVRSFLPTGAPLGGAIKVSNTSTGPTQSDIDINPEGQSVVAWADDGSGGSSVGILARTLKVQAVVSQGVVFTASGLISNPLNHAPRSDIGAVELSTHAVTGRLYHDTNGNGAQDGEELGLVGWSVYHDADQDGQHDLNEPTAQTDANGDYTLVIEETNTPVTVRPRLPAGWFATSPLTARYDVSSAPAGTTANRDFGLSVTFSVAAATVSEDPAQSTVQFVVQLSAPVDVVTAVSYVTSSLTATPDSDYLAAAGRLVFAPGETSKTFALTVLNDATPELPETLQVTLSNPSNASLGTASAVITIQDDDIGFSVDSPTIAEGQSGTKQLLFTITKNAPSAATHTVDYAVLNGEGTANLNEDYDNTFGTLSFAPNELVKTVAVTIKGDRSFEPDETIHLRIANPSAGSAIIVSPGIGTILNDDANLIVNSTLDKPDLNPGDGMVDTGTPGEVTLRAAIMEANAWPGDDAITLPAGHYTLTRSGGNEDLSGTGDLDVFGGYLDIIGAGAATTLINGNGLDRVFDIHPGVPFRLKDATVTGGLLAGATEDGGGMRVRGNVTLERVYVSDNSTAPGGQGRGGGIFASGDGSGVTLLSGTLAENKAGLHGGGVAIVAGAALAATNSTISGNSVDGPSAQLGGGVYAFDAYLGLTTTTVTLNSAVIGGGVATSGMRAAASFVNSIIAQNSALGEKPDVDVNAAWRFDNINNLIGISTLGVSGPQHGVNGHQVGTLAAPINAQLEPLAWNGGPTPTHRPRLNSPALDRASTDGMPTIDQRGVARPQPTDFVTATVNYGDGAGLQPLPLNADKTYRLDHAYALPGNYEVVVGATDRFGARAFDIVPVTVTGGGAGNTLPSFSVSLAPSIQSAFAFQHLGSFSDPDANTWSAVVDFGDGSGPQPLVLNGDKTFALNHLYAAAGTYPVVITLTDGIHAVSDAGIVTVGNPATTTALPYTSAPLGVSKSPFVVNASTSGDQYLSDVHVDSTGRVIFVWNHPGFDGSDATTLARIYDRAGNPLTGQFVINDRTIGDQTNGVVATDTAGNLYFAFQDWGGDAQDWAIKYRRFSSTGSALGGSTLANQYQSSSQGGPSITSDLAGNQLLVWNSYGQDGSEHAVVARRYDASGSALGSEFIVNTTTGGEQFQAIPLMPPSATPGDGITDHFVVVFRSPDASAYGVRARRFNLATGAPLGDDFPVNQQTAGDQYNVSAAMDAQGRFVVAWESNSSGDINVYARLFDADGTPLTGDILVNETTAGTQQYPYVGQSAQGDFYVTWQANSGQSVGHYVRSFDARGNPTSNETLVSAGNTGSTTTATGPGGLTAVVYGASDGSGLGVFGYLLERAGSATTNVPMSLTGSIRNSPAAPAPDIGAVERGPATISGRVFHDYNSDGDFDAGESDLAGRIVFADANANGSYDIGEFGTATAADGSYTLVMPDSAATTRIAVQSPAGWVSNNLASGYQELTPTAGQTFSNRDFAMGVEVSVVETSVLETTAAQAGFSITVRLSAPVSVTTAVTVSTAPYLPFDAATVGVDYTAKSERFFFAPGEVQKTFAVAVQNDTVDEYDEKFHVDLSLPLNARIATTRTTMAILDDDASPMLSIADVQMAEGDVGTGTMAFNLVRTGNASERQPRVNVRTRDVQAVTGEDYIAVDTSVLLSANATYTVSVPIIGDFVAESHDYFDLDLELFDVDLITALHPRGTIMNDDPVLTVNSTLDKPDLTPGNFLVETGTVSEITLRAAIMEANALAGPDEITLPAGIYTLTRSGANENAALTGDFDIAEELNIVGAGADITIIDAAQLDRIFHVRPGATLRLSNLTLRNGKAGEGGAIKHEGALLELRDVHIVDNSATISGGGIDSRGEVVAEYAHFLRNTAPQGGALYNGSGADAEMTTSSFQSNSALTGAGLGGAVANFGAFQLYGGDLFENQGKIGGGIYNAGDLVLAQANAQRNSAWVQGGVLYHDAESPAQTRISNSYFGLNDSGGSGGAIELSSAGLLWIENSTFHANQAADDGGAISNSGGELELQHVTIAGNRSVGGAGGGIASAATTRLRNTLISDNLAASDNDVTGGFISQGHNLVSIRGSASGLVHAALGNIVGTAAAPIDARLGSLYQAGGSSPALQLRSGSPAIDAGDNAASLDVDQHYHQRPQDGDNNGTSIVDIGAFEQPFNRPPTILPQSLSAAEGTQVEVGVGFVTASDLDNDDLIFAIVGGSGANLFEIDSSQGEVTVAGALDFEAAASYELLVQVTDRWGLTAVATITINLTNVNESPVLVGSGIDDIARNDGAPVDNLSLSSLFTDPDAGDTLNYTAVSSNPSLVTATIIGNTLRLTYLTYSAAQDRSPALVTVRAIDGAGQEVADTFTVSVSPAASVEYYLVVVAQPTTQSELATLPTSLSNIAVGQTFYAEVWLRDLLAGGFTSLNITSSGVQRAGVDLHFNPNLATADELQHAGVFNLFFGGTIDQLAGAVENFSARTNQTGKAVTPTFGRLGYVTFNATAAGSQVLSLGIDDLVQRTRRAAAAPAGGDLHPTQITLGPAVTIVVDPEGGVGATTLFPAVPHSIALSGSPAALAAGDVDNDGDADLTVLSATGATLTTLGATPSLQHTVTLAAGAVRSDLHFGVRPIPGILRGRVFDDLNQSGTKELSEPGLEHRTLYLDLDDDGALDADEPTAETDSDGIYEFKGVRSLSSYIVRQVPVEGWTSTFPSAGKHQLSLGPAETIDGLDFGNRLTSGVGGAAIKGKLFHDTDGDGVQDAGEVGLLGWRVYLDVNNDRQYSAGEPSVLTRDDSPVTPGIDERGDYEFPSLGAATYAIRVVQQASYKQVYPLGNQLEQSTHRAGDGPQSVALADLNNDQRLDIAIANGITNNVSVLLATSDGGFEPARSFPTGFGASAVVAIDLGGDSLPDLAVANLYSGTIVLLQNKGGGNFEAKPAVSAGAGPRHIAAGDIDGDSDIDLVVSNEFGNSLAILKNNGSFSFSRTTLPMAGRPIASALVKLDGNSSLDLAVVNSDTNRVTLLTNSGSGVFSVGATHAVGSAPFAIAAADLDGDQDQELVVANILSNDISILKNNGGGAFASAVSVSVGLGPSSIAVGDLDRDGDLDLAVTNGNSTSLSILRNSGSGSFLVSENFGVIDFPLSLPFAVAAGDLGGDGNLDLIVANSDADSISVLRNNPVAGAQLVTLTTSSTSGINFAFQPTGPIVTAPTLDAIAPGPAAIPEDAGQQSIPLTGISAGGASEIALEVTSNNPSLLSALQYAYTAGATTGSVLYQPSPNASGTAQVTVKITNGGADGNLATTADNLSITRSFAVTVSAVNDPPSLAPIAGPLSLPPSSPQQQIGLTGISAGPLESQTLSITASSSLPALIPTPLVNYTQGSSTATLVFTPAPGQSGSATITVTVSDGSAITTQSLVVNVQSPCQAPPPASYTIDEDTQLLVSAPGVLTGQSGAQVVRFDAFSCQGATVTIGADGRLTYDPRGAIALQNLNRTESFVDSVAFDVNDGHGSVTTQTVGIRVTGINDWYAPIRSFDVDRDGIVAPLDALYVIIELNAVGPGRLPGLIGNPLRWLDVNDDGQRTALDALLIINYLNAGGQGEAAEEFLASSNDALGSDAWAWWELTEDESRRRNEQFARSVDDALAGEET